jgi:hypothetical protein
MGANASKGSYAVVADEENGSVTENFECGVCCGHNPEAEGIKTCPDHFYCNDCALEVLYRSMKNTIDEFSLSCCACTQWFGIPMSVFEHLVDLEFKARYRAKLHEHITPVGKRVFCTNPACAKFLSALVPMVVTHDTQPDARSNPALAKCDNCQTSTCLHCKHEHQVGHVCIEDAFSPDLKDMPVYSARSRIKPCPKCTTLLELKESCNHATCTQCKHQFCFVCLLPFNGFHDWQSTPIHEARAKPIPRVGGGCPIYRDPCCGYDDEGFERNERNERGLHLYTGLDRDGGDRIENQHRTDVQHTRLQSEEHNAHPVENHRCNDSFHAPLQAEESDHDSNEASDADLFSSA